jgi:rare lipoprotein A
MSRRALLLVPLISLAAACAGRRIPAPPSPGTVQEGLASWYGLEERGRPTASGEIMDPESMTAAHRTYPFGTVVQVEDIDTGRSVEVSINDRGPFIRGRIIDLSHGAARELGIVGRGVARVRIRVLSTGVGLPAGYAWRVQTGSFLEEARARQLAQRIEERGFQPVQISEYREGGRTYFRVWVGSFEDRAQAEALAARFRRDGQPAFVIQGRN